MRVKVRLTTEAARDIEEVLDFTLDTFGEKKCEQYRYLIRDALKEISHNPTSLRSRARLEIHPYFRTYHLARPRIRARHFFLYRYDGSEVAIVGRLLHDTMDITRNLPPDFDPPY